VEPVHLQAEDQPCWPLWLPDLRDHLPRWLALRVRWQGPHCHLWDLQEGKHLYSLDAGDTINALCFSPNRYWLCAATSLAIKIWDLESKLIVAELTPDDLPPPSASKKTLPVSCLSLCWSHDGNTLFSGYTDGAIRVWAVTMAGSR